MRKVTQEWVMACVPKFINDEQCATILATPQMTELEMQALATE